MLISSLDAYNSLQKENKKIIESTFCKGPFEDVLNVSILRIPHKVLVWNSGTVVLENSATICELYDLSGSIQFCKSMSHVSAFTTYTNKYFLDDCM